MGLDQFEHVAWNESWSQRLGVRRVIPRGSFLLLGDAAHVHSPAGGQGMNTSIRDALVLADVLARSRDLDDLDEYERRRRPVAQEVLILTDCATRVATLRSPTARRIRNAAIRSVGHLPSVRRRLATRLAGLDDR